VVSLSVTQGRFSRLTPLLSLVPLAVVGCAAADVPCGLLPVLENSSSTTDLLFDRCTGQFALGSVDTNDSPLPAAPADSPGLAWAVDQIQVTMNQGRYVFDGGFGVWQGLGEGTLEANTWQFESESRPASVEWELGDYGSFKIRLQVQGEVDRVSIAFGCSDGERFYGTGARSQGTDHTGESPLLYVTEQGIGQTDYDLDEFDLLRGRIGDSYFPVPWTVTDRGLGAAIGGTPIARMYLCGEQEPGVLRFEAWSDQIEVQLFPASSPREAVGNWTLSSGPPAPAPAWAYGPWVAVQHGSEELMRSATRLRELGIPASAMWAQDWIGGGSAPLGGYDLDFHWEWDEDLYPQLPERIDELHGLGFAFMGYFNPFVTDEFDEWNEALASGFLPLTPEGDTYEFTIVDRNGSVVDLSNPEARDWLRSYMTVAAEMGLDGWMCDFAEWMPFDAKVSSGTGQDLHNEYPLLWQRVNKEALDGVHGEGNALCFNRSGWTGTQALVPVTWGGDQETSFARDDGIATAREIGVGLGLSGIGRYGSDIAGFSSVWGGSASRELYWRWIEMAAFEPVMRTHDGLAGTENWHWERDPETIEHFSRYAKWHLRLLPYLQLLDREYMEQGLPFMRHSILVEQGAGAELRDAVDQHFLGDDLLVAPVLEEGATSRTVVLPAGSWHLLTGVGSWQTGPLGETITVDAPIGTAPVFARGGAVLPLGDPSVVTSYPGSNSQVIGVEDRAESLHLAGFSGGNSEGLLADGTQMDFQATEVDGSVVPSIGELALASSCASADDSDCVESVALEEGRALFRISWSAGPQVLSGAGWTLNISLGAARSGTFELRFPPSDS
jgi:sulfoquinovosidase